MSIDKTDLRSAAIHEAGHMVIGNILGGICTAQIWKNPSPSPDSKNWRGNCTILSMPKNPVIFGLAGLASEYIDAGLIDPTDIVLQIEMIADVSESDARLIGSNWQSQIKETIEIIKKNWEEINEEAEYLIKNME